MTEGTQQVPDDSSFALVESILWEHCCGFWLLHEHMERLRNSAIHFGYIWDETRVLSQLDDVVKKLGCDSIVRVELHRDGVINMMTRPASNDRRPVRATPARLPIDTNNLFLYHSTTRRDHYPKAVASISGYDEVLLWNNRGETTGSCTSNLVVEINGEYYTPPINSGAMPGAYRANLMQQGRLTERPVRLDELASCTKIYLINSSIGWREVILV